MKWEHDYGFKQVAELCWPHDFALAWTGRRKGRAEARRLMAERHEGYRVALKIAGLANEVAKQRKDLAARAGVA